MVRDSIVTRFTKVEGGMTAHSHMRIQFRCLGNRSALTLKPATPKTDWSLSGSLVHRQTWRLTGSARAHVQRHTYTALLYLGNGLADCVQIWYVGWQSLTKCLPQVIGGVHLHVRTCAPLFHIYSTCCYPVMVGPIALRFGMYLGTH